MALPGMRGYGRDDNWAGGRNSAYGRMKTTANGDFNNGVSPLDPSTGRRVDSMEQRLNKQENNHRSLLEQMMKLQQDFKVDMKRREQTMNEEKNHRTRMESTLQSASVKMNDLDDRLRRVEDSARENKNALSQLISHTKNVERAVTLNQQDLAAKKETQGTKLQELIHKVNQIQQNKETMDKTVYMIKDEVRDMDSKVETLQIEISDFEGALKLQSNMIETINNSRHSRKEEKEGEQKMTETQRAMLEAKIMQCQQTTLDLGAKLSTEKRERDQDMDQINSRLTDLTADIKDRDRQRETEMREQEAKAREQMSLGSAEKQKIIMQISAVQTDIKRTLDERDSKIREVTIGKIQEIDGKMAESSRLQAQQERDLRTLIEAEVSKQQLVADQSTDTVKKLLESETETSRARIQEQSGYINQIETTINQVKSDLLDELSKVSHESEAKEKVLDAKIEDLSDKLRFGMATMQAAIGERSSDGTVGGGSADDRTIPIQEIEMLQDEAMEGLREGLAKQIADIEAEVEGMKSDIRKQNEIVEDGVRRQEMIGEEANNILGDKLHQKMDSIAFTQERMRRQVEDLQDKIGGAPNDIGDLRDRVEDIERSMTKGPDNSKIESDISELRSDVNKVLGKDESGRGEVDGIPNLNKLETDVDELKNDVALAKGKLAEVDDSLNSKITSEKQDRIDETAGLRREIERLEKKQKALKSKLKGKLGMTGVPETDTDRDEDEGNE